MIGYHSYREFDSTCAYFLTCEEGERTYVKIGISKTPRKRLQALTQGLPFEPRHFAYTVFPSRQLARSFEQTMLLGVSGWSSRGEWTVVEPEQMAKFLGLVRKVTASFETPSKKLNWIQMDVPNVRAAIRSERSLAKPRKKPKLRGLQGLAYKVFKQQAAEA